MEINGSTEPLTATNGRRIKFTPERLQQIKNLVDRGLSREQIAETIGVRYRLPARGSGLACDARGRAPQQSSDEPTMPDHRAKFALRVYGDRPDHLDHPDHLGLVVDRGHDSVMRDLRTCL